MGMMNISASLPRGMDASGLKGVPADSLHLVAQATTLSSAMYASPAWWGFASVQNRDKIEALLNRMKRRGFLHPEHPSADGIAAKALFSAICMHPNHVLSSFLPRPKQHQYYNNYENRGPQLLITT